MAGDLVAVGEGDLVDHVDETEAVLAGVVGGDQLVVSQAHILGVVEALAGQATAVAELLELEDVLAGAVVEVGVLDGELRVVVFIRVVLPFVLHGFGDGEFLLLGIDFDDIGAECENLLVKFLDLEGLLVDDFLLSEALLAILGVVVDFLALDEPLVQVVFDIDFGVEGVATFLFVVGAFVQDALAAAFVFDSAGEGYFLGVVDSLVFDHLSECGLVAEEIDDGETEYLVDLGIIDVSVPLDVFHGLHIVVFFDRQVIDEAFADDFGASLDFFEVVGVLLYEVIESFFIAFLFVDVLFVFLDVAGEQEEVQVHEIIGIFAYFFVVFADNFSLFILSLFLQFVDELSWYIFHKLIK